MLNTETKTKLNRLQNFSQQLLRPQIIFVFLLLATVSAGAYYFQNRVEPVQTSANSTSIVAPPATCNYYASPTGSTSGDGSLGNPWDLQTALNTNQITSGVTLCLRGGTYNGKYVSTLNGGTVRSAPGEWAKIDGNASTTLTSAINSTQTNIPVANGALLVGINEVVIDQEVIQIYSLSGNNITNCGRGASGTTGVAEAHANGATVYIAGTQLLVQGGNTTYRDFEIMNSNPQRRGLIFPEVGRGNNITNSGDGNNFINLISHDGINGVFMGSGSRNSTVYGVLSYNNGFFHPVESEYSGGHNYYLENAAGYSRVYENIALNAFRNGMQLYGRTGAYIGGDMRGGIVSQSSFWGEGRNLIYGPDNVQSPTGSVTESHFYRPAGDGYTIAFGYGSGIDAGTFTNNYLVGSDTAFVGETLNSLTFTGNIFYSSSNSTRYVITGATSYTWDNNTYYNTDSSQYRFSIAIPGQPNLTYPQWKTNSGYDTNSLATNSTMPDTVIVRPNAYETGRANIIIYASSAPASINVNLNTTGLTNGQSYEIRNAFDFFGDIVATGTYNSSSSTISLPLNGNATDVATPVGMSSTPASTCPEFCVFVVLPVYGGTPPPSDTTPPVLSSGSPSGSQPAGTTSANLTLSTNETATCKYGTTANVVYASLPSTFTTTNSTSHSTPVSSLSNGTNYSYYIRCQDTSGNPTTQDFTISFSVSNPTGDTTAPTVSITAPSNSATVSGTTTTVSANASDNTGVVGVQFKLDGSNLGTEDTVSPYSIVWDTTGASNSTHTLTAVARDAAGNSTTSSSVTVTVNNATPPSTGGGGGGSGGGGGGTTTPSTTTTGLVNSSGTYYLLTGGYRKGVTSPGIMYSCGFEFKDARLATPSDLALPSSLLLPCGGALVKSTQDPTVYLISRGQRYAFTSSQVFTGLGFKFSSVLLVTNPELQALPQGSNLSSPSSAHLPEVDININGTIYWLDTNLTKHPYPSLQVWNSWHRDGDFTTVVPANQNDLNLTTGSNVPMRF